MSHIMHAGRYSAWPELTLLLLVNLVPAMQLDIEHCGLKGPLFRMRSHIMRPSAGPITECHSSSHRFVGRDPQASGHCSTLDGQAGLQSLLCTGAGGYHPHNYQVPYRECGAQHYALLQHSWLRWLPRPGLQLQGLNPECAAQVWAGAQPMDGILPPLCNAPGQHAQPRARQETESC